MCIAPPVCIVIACIIGNPVCAAAFSTVGAVVRVIVQVPLHVATGVNNTVIGYFPLQGQGVLGKVIVLEIAEVTLDFVFTQGRVLVEGALAVQRLGQ